VDERLESAVDRWRDLDAQLTARSTALGRLAASLRGHEHRGRVRYLLAAGVGISPEPGAGPLAEVAGRTAVVLEAYRELCELRPLPSET
jgi:hypothetical protein